MTAGDVYTNIFSTKKLDQFNVLKADILGRVFYGLKSPKSMLAIMAVSRKWSNIMTNLRRSFSLAPSVRSSRPKKARRRPGVVRNVEAGRCPAHSPAFRSPNKPIHHRLNINNVNVNINIININPLTINYYRHII